MCLYQREWRLPAILVLLVRKPYANTVLIITAGVQVLAPLPQAHATIFGPLPNERPAARTSAPKFIDVAVDLGLGDDMVINVRQPYGMPKESKVLVYFVFV
jgi:hypothetical protein